VYHYYEKDKESTGFWIVSVELYKGEKETKRCEFPFLFLLVLLQF